MATTRVLGRDLTTEEWESSEFRFRNLIALFEAGIRFPTLIHGKKSKKNLQEKFLWVNNDLVVLSYMRTKVYVDRVPVLFGADKELADALENITITDKYWLDCFLAAGGMSAAWRARGKMPKFFVDKEAVLWINQHCFLFLPSVEDIVSLEKALRGLPDGELQVRDVDLVEALPPPFLAKDS
ncbi:unnamed protein product [Lactuca saligna]|uniref:Uncharacterized protein n=1 Tax=Lactuca saligna TaxID=75948 RepID=A0AA35ZSP7_LACSI|nr:unnamed protein product [Lactuca saligna]